MNDISSRGSFEEKLRAITEGLHQEIHLIESMQKEPHKVSEITPILDKVRLNRQELVRMTFGDSVNSNYWCNLKHSLTKVRHLEENLQNAARDNPSEVEKFNHLLQEAVIDRDKAIELFRSGVGKGGGCVRCRDDFGGDYEVFDESVIGKSAQSLNTEKEEVGFINKEVHDMVASNLMDYGWIQAAQVFGQGGSYLADVVDSKFQFVTQGEPGLLRTRNVVNVVGGTALGMAGLMVVKKPTWLKTLLIIGGTAMAAKGVADVVKDMTANIKTSAGVGSVLIQRSPMLPQANLVPPGYHSNVPSGGPRSAIY